jgi:hypothetical protein
MRSIGIALCTAAAAALGTAWAQQTTNGIAPAASPESDDLGTNFTFEAISAEDLAKQVLRPPTGKAPILTTPTLYDTRPQPPLSAEAQTRQYLGFRIGMSVEEATLLAETSGKKLEAVEKDRRYSMAGCLTDVPRPERAHTMLLFDEKKNLKLVMLFWDDDRVLYYNLQPMLEKKYGKPLKADELFRRYWILENNDSIRLLYEVAARQTSLVYGDKDSVFRLSEEEKREIPKQYEGL